MTQRLPGGITRSLRGPSAPTPLNPTSILGQLPLKEPTAGDLLSLPPTTEAPNPFFGTTQIEGDYAPREILGRLASAIQRDPSAVERGGFNRLVERFGLGGNVPALEQLAVAAAQRGMGGAPSARFAPSLPPPASATDLPDPSDYAEGTTIEDDMTGQQYQLVNGAWQIL